MWGEAKNKFGGSAVPQALVATCLKKITKNMSGNDDDADADGVDMPYIDCTTARTIQGCRQPVAWWLREGRRTRDRGRGDQTSH